MPVEIKHAHRLAERGVDQLHRAAPARMLLALSV
jgi:hypothetical protein